MLSELTESIWIASTPIRFAGTWFPHVMAAIRLRDGSVVLHSPCHLSEQLQVDLQRVGPVGHVIAPNWFHDLYLADYRQMYPEATFWGPPLLRRQKPGIIDRVLNEVARPPWYDEMPHIALTGLLTFDECVFFHARTRTLIVADLLMNLRTESDTSPYTKLTYRISGLDGRLAVFPLLRWLGPRAVLKRAANRMIEWAPDSLVVGHGAPILRDATPQLRGAFRWLVA